MARAGNRRARTWPSAISTVDWCSHAVNHWNLAVAVHKVNFPTIQAHEEDITEITAATYGITDCDMLWASPSCVHHSRARGGKPMSDQQRSHADEVVERWLKVANVSVLLVENVPEFADWGPLYTTHSGGCHGGEKCLKVCHFDKPIPQRKGEYFRRFQASLKALGYKTEYRILCAADFGDPTKRHRFFMQAVKDGHSIVWPEPTHRDPKKGADMFTGHLPVWRTAAECIDWSIPCPSIFDRKRPLADATLRRIAAGVVRYVLEAKRPFLVNLSHGGRLEDLDEPMRTLTAEPKGGDRAIIVPTLVGVGGRAGQSRPRGVDEPFGVLTTKADGALVAAFLSTYHGARPGEMETDPRGASLDAPVPTLATAKHHALIAATLIQTGYGEAEGQAPRILDIQAPLGTVVAGGIKHALIAATIMTNTTGHAPTELGEPIPAITTGNHHALVASFLTKYHQTGGQWQPLTDPLHAVTTKDEFGLVTVEINGETYIITDIGMRMLQPHELAKAMGFPDGFQWIGEHGKPLTKAQQVKMIGNACPVNTVAELIKAVVLQRPGAFGMPKEAVA